MKSALVLRHVPYEGLAGLRQPIEAAGYAIREVDVPDAPPALDGVADADLVVSMGGAMGAYEGDAHPWIGREVAALAARIASGLPTLGICLGSQMIAAALGQRVYPGPVKEVGFAPVSILGPDDSPLRHLAGVPVLHWHGDTFDLPEGAERLASTYLYANQAFRIGGHVLAIQCHPEMGEDPEFERWLAGSDDYLVEAGTSAAAVRADYAALGPAAVRAGRALMTEWLGRLDG